jgi:trehalose-6-phosphate synthase
MLFKTLRLQLRFLLPLTAAMALAAMLAVPLLDQVTLRWFSRDLSSRGMLLANALSESVAAALADGRPDRLNSLFRKAVEDERLLAIGLCSDTDRLLQASERFPADPGCAGMHRHVGADAPPLELASGRVHVSEHDIVAVPRVPTPPVVSIDDDWAPGEMRADTAVAAQAVVPPPAPVRMGRLVLLHDLSFIDRRSQDTRRYLIGVFTVLGLVIALITVVVAQISWRGWVRGVRGLMRGEGLLTPMAGAPLPELAPLAGELRSRLRDLEDEYRRAQGPEREWTAERLRGLLLTQLAGDQVIVVSNREPYIHDRDGDRVLVRRPASGLVTAVEPVMRACSGTWIAHGSGSADRDVVDRHDRVAVPPGAEDYRLRRIWLTPEEEEGYYYGFANEGLWPLCHVAHVRPVFRESDWQAYRAVNQRFADAVVAEARSEDPVVLVQDYHFALLPAMVREQLPQATILTFWHIPWPNAESFGICPWRREILQGMLGSTILGFHTRYHCQNFIETVDRCLEARIEREHATIAYGGKETLVESYPISIAWPDATVAWPTIAECRRRVRERLQLPADACLAVGVDRFDYTKGILERLNAVERLLEKHPERVGRFFFVQVAAPTRSALDEYRSFQQRVQDTTDRINQRFGRDGCVPVHLLARHHEPDAVNELFRAADICVVTSLHDGMNLVCKEFVAARDDEQGVLVLSRFAGAARELSEALLVNPYHVEETADALFRAATMPAAEQRERMAALRSTVREFNVYRWAGRMLADAGRWRLRNRIEARVRRFQNA